MLKSYFSVEMFLALMQENYALKVLKPVIGNE